MRRSPRLLPAILLSVALTAGCGDDGDTTAEPDPASADADTPVDTGEPEGAEAEATTTSVTTTSTESTAPSSTAPPTADMSLVGGESSDANVEEVQRFMGSGGEEDGPFYMVNLIRHREQAEYPDGRETDLTGAQANAIYGEFMGSTKLPEVGAEVVYFGDVETDLAGGTAFDQVGIVRYPSRAAFMAMAQDPEFQEMNVHKQAGVLDTVVMATSLIDLPPLPEPEDPPFPATADDPVFAFVHVLDYRDTAEYQEGDIDADPTRSGEEAVQIYSANAGSVAAPLGVRPVAWFEVEATIIGPVDVWDEVRINMFPSHATFDALTSDPTWQSGAHHRAAGLEDTYAIMTLPRINGFNGVVADG